MEKQKNLGITAPLQAGTIAGFVATIPMTLFMALMHQLLPDWQKYALPPLEITDEVTERAKLRDKMDKTQFFGVSLFAHFSYGASMGSLYLPATSKIPLPAALKGAGFGLLVWAASYLGWLPLAHFSAAAIEEEPQRNLLMIVAHLIWGVVTGMLAQKIVLSTKH